jgi:stage II sporulation protein D
VVSGLLVPIVTMDLETAVASVVAAEGLPGSPIERLKAQAVAARSYLVAARGRHERFDFCDTTHCQFLRELPVLGAAAFNASAETRGLVIAYNAKTFAAMYTRSCGGHTRTPADVGMASGEYPYYSVECKYCRDHPARWRSQITATDAVSLRSSNESARLAVDRRLGWGAVQSDDFAMTRRGTQLVVEGVGQGHGIGLCQAGAVGMANERFNFRQILAHYYPNTKIVSVNRR